MKILFIATSGCPDGMYGGSVALRNLLIYLLNQKYKLVITFPDKGELSKWCECNHIKCCYTFRYTLTTGFSLAKSKTDLLYPLRFLRMLIRRFIVQQQLDKIIKKIKPDIIHTNVGPCDIANSLAIKNKIPHVWHIREYQDLDFGMKPYPNMKKFKNIIHHPNNYLIAITKDIYRHFDMDHGKAIVIYDGVFFKKDIETCSQKKDYFLFVGSIKETKGVMDLLRAYKLYFTKGGRKKVLFAGAGGSQKYLEKILFFIKSNQLDNYISFLGFRTDVYELMKNAMAQIVPSQSEGFGFITAEAMYNQCLVIGKNTGGTKEQFDNGLAFCGQEIGLRFLSINELAKLLYEVDEKGCGFYQAMIERAFHTVNEFYTIENNSLKVDNFYHQIINGY